MKNLDTYCLNESKQPACPWKVMEDHFPSELVIQYKEAFGMLDHTHVGKISVQDVTTVANSMGYFLSEDEMLKFVGRVVDHNDINDCEKCVGFSEFLATMTSIITDCIPEDEVLRIFREFDKDGDGFISPNELRNLLSSLGEDVTDQDVQAMMSEADTDGDGMVSLQEFIHVMTFPNMHEGPSVINVPSPRLMANSDNAPSFPKMNSSCSSPNCSSDIDRIVHNSNDANLLDSQLDVEFLDENSPSDKSDENKLPESATRRRRSVVDWIKIPQKHDKSSRFHSIRSSSEAISSSSSNSLISMASAPAVVQKQSRRSSLTKTLRNGREAILATARSLRKLSR